MVESYIYMLNYDGVSLFAVLVLARLVTHEPRCQGSMRSSNWQDGTRMFDCDERMHVHC